MGTYIHACIAQIAIPLINMGPEEESSLLRTRGRVVMLVGGRVSGPLGRFMGAQFGWPRMASLQFTI